MKTACLFFAFNRLMCASFVILLCAIQFSLNAQPSSPFVPAFHVVDKANLIMLGNVSVSCDITGVFTTNCTTCANMQNSLNPNFSCGNNGNFAGVSVDIDNDPSTFMSSSDSLNLENCNQILYAGLYFCQQSLTPADSVIKIKFNSGSYQNISLSACTTFTNTYGTASFSNIDITGMLSAAGPKTRITVANLKADQGNSLGGWSIVVVYKDATKPKRSVNVWHGVQQSNSVIPLSGFLTQPAGPVNFECGVVGWEGERNLGGDYFRFNGFNLGNAMNSTNNFFNATITNNGVLTPFRLPNFNNTVGLDADIVVPNNSTYTYLGNSASTCTLSTASANDGFIPQVLTLAIDVYDPNVNSYVKITDVNGGAIVAGDVLEYKVKINAIGDEASVNTRYSDTLDFNIDFVPNSLKIMYGPNAGSKTDATGDDQLDYNTTDRTVLLRVGTGASTTSGGLVSNSATGADSTVFTYSVVVTNSCLKIKCKSVVNFSSAVFGIGSISTNTYVNTYATLSFDANLCPLYTPYYSFSIQPCFSPATTNSSPVCSGNTFTLHATPDAIAQYNWSGPLSYTSTAQTNSLTLSTTSMSGIYTVTMSIPASTCSYVATTIVSVHQTPTLSIFSVNNPTICSGNTSTITPAGAYTYTLTDGTSNHVGFPFVVSPSVTTNYTITAMSIDNCPAGTTEQQLITVNATPTIAIAGVSSANICNGNNSIITPGGADSYTLEPGSINGTSFTVTPGTSTNYTITGISDAHCPSSNTVEQLIVVSPTPTLSIISISNSTLCAGGTSTIIPGGASTYTITDGSNSSSVFPFLVSPATTTSYSVTATGSNNCLATNPATIHITVYAVPQLTITPIAVNCYHESSGSVIIVTNPLTVTISGDSLTNLAAGNYSYVITNTLTGCESTQTVTILQPDSPLEVNLASFITSDCGQSTGSVNTITTGGTPGYTYTWNTGVHTDNLSGLAEGTYTLVVSDLNRCSDTLVHHVSCDPLFFIPEFFTPNGDGKNDMFEITGIQKYPNNTLQIFNRWGSLVYSKHNYNNEWEGKPNVSDATGDSFLPAGVYFVIFDFGVDESNAYHGYTHLMR